MNFYFIGVSTQQSAMVQIMPLWAQALAVELNLIGIDLPIDATPGQYRDAISEIKKDSQAIVAVVTSHKLKIYEHNLNRFDEVDAVADLTKEIGTILKRGHLLIGMAAPDCLSTSLSLKTILGSNYWQQNKSNVLCFGAGGVARSIVLSLLFDFKSGVHLTEKQMAKPKKLLLVDIDQKRLESMEEFLKPFSNDLEIEYICHSRDKDNDQLLTNLPCGSLIINATGMGKDRPESPLSNKACFPKKSIVWDLNYRGEQLFIEQARSQCTDQELGIYDGWTCFLQGWIQAIQFGLKKKFSIDEFEQLRQIAETVHLN